MDIRDEKAGDPGEISVVIRSAFRDAAHADGNEAEIVIGLRSAGSLSVSLVAVEDERILGHVAFSPVLIDGIDAGWFGLGPVAVLPDRQGKGVGEALIREGLSRLRAMKARGCVVLGDPAYYRRFGFAPCAALSLANVPPEYFQALAFDEEEVAGSVSYHSAFYTSA